MDTPDAKPTKPSLKAPFTDTAIRALPTNIGAYDAGSDGGGLQLVVTAVGSKIWHLHYRFNGKKNQITLGRYPTVTLAEARERRDEAKRLLAAGKNPSAARKAQKAVAAVAAASTFAALSEELIAKKTREKKRPATISQLHYYVGLLTPLHRRPIAEIEPAEVLMALRRIEDRGNASSAHRARSFASEVWRYAIATGRAKANPVTELRGALAAHTVTPNAAITEPKAFGTLLRVIDGYSNEYVRAALRFTALTGLRTNEVRLLEWADIDLDEARLSIPGSRMKKGRDYSAPLSRQVVALLKEQHARTGRGALVFIGEPGRGTPMSDTTMINAMRSLGYGSGKATPHGFRSSFSTMANESGMWSVDAIEFSASRVDANASRRTYNRAALWDERKRLMQWWGNECDKMRSGISVVRSVEA